MSIFALTQPHDALEHRSLLMDVAAGDFATYRDLRAARASILSVPAVTSCSYSAFTQQLYRELLSQLVSIAVDSDQYRGLWGEEDVELTASERAIESGHVTITEQVDLDLAVERAMRRHPTPSRRPGQRPLV